MEIPYSVLTDDEKAVALYLGRERTLISAASAECNAEFVETWQFDVSGLYRR
jgi:hypothetical protein